MSAQNTGTHTSKNPRIAECVCEHAYQDAKYGRGNRVQNPRASKPNTKGTYRCTVCGREHDVK